MRAHLRIRSDRDLTHFLPQRPKVSKRLDGAKPQDDENEIYWQPKTYGQSVRDAGRITAGSCHSTRVMRLGSDVQHQSQG